MATKRKTTTRKKPAVSHYDSADYLRNHEEIAAYLEATFEEAGDDAAFMVHALGVAARAHGMVELASKTGLSREGLYNSLSGKGNPSFATVMKVAHALGVKLVPQKAA